MESSVQVFWVPKLGNSEEEYEDAYAFSEADRHFAVADGATESSFADRWARALVNQYIADPPPVLAEKTPFPEWLVPLQHEWHGGIDWDNLPWFAEEKAKSGGFATLLGLSFFDPSASKKASLMEGMTQWLFRRQEPQTLRWRAMAVGDSCLFHVREDKLIRSFPLDQASQFNSRPVLLCSNASNNTGVWPEVRFWQGDCQPGDLFILATDAIAKWFLDRVEEGVKPWETLGGIATNMDFQDFVAGLRESKDMRNDDTTLLLCRWQSQAKTGRTLFFRKT